MTELITAGEVHGAFALIVKNADNPALKSVVKMAKNGQRVIGYELYSTVVRIVNRMSKWKGEEAQMVRKTLIQFAYEYREENSV